MVQAPELSKKQQYAMFRCKYCAWFQAVFPSPVAVEDQDVLFGHFCTPHGPMREKDTADIFYYFWYRTFEH